jgi:hypothetical protein
MLRRADSAPGALAPATPEAPLAYALPISTSGASFRSAREQVRCRSGRRVICRQPAAASPAVRRPALTVRWSAAWRKACASPRRCPSLASRRCPLLHFPAGTCSLPWPVHGLHPPGHEHAARRASDHRRDAHAPVPHRT